VTIFLSRDPDCCLRQGSASVPVYCWPLPSQLFWVLGPAGHIIPSDSLQGILRLLVYIYLDCPVADSLGDTILTSTSSDVADEVLCVRHLAKWKDWSHSCFFQDSSVYGF
jgi:hypothetical protein